MTATASKPLDFLLIGVPRAGTTSLFRYLRTHPRLYMPLEKEVPFFSHADWLSKGWDEFYDVYFSKAPDDALIGKMTPQYWGIPGVVERIAETMPKVKLIVVYRHPIERAISHHRLSVRNIEGELPPFEQASANDPELTNLGDYGRLTKHLLEHFPRNQVLPLFTQDIEQQPEATVDKILEFLGLPSGFRPSNLGKRYNRSGSQQRFPGLIPMLKRNPIIRPLWRLIPKRSRAVIKGLYNAEIGVKHDDLPPIDANLQAQLTERYRKDLRELEAIIGREVPWPDLR